MYKAINNATICAVSTAQGGAINIVRVSGKDAITIVDSIFSKDIIDAPAYKVIYGTIVCSEIAGCEHEEVHSDVSSNECIDDVLVTLFRAPYSYTGENCVEISCHGSLYITQSILNLLLQKGCIMAQPGEFTQRAFLNGKMDLTQAEAVADLIASNNKAAHKVAMTQMRGGFSNKLKDLRNQLLQITSLLELELDFSEEDVEFADRKELLSLAKDIEREISILSDSFAKGNALKNGIPVAIIGAPNVGKSTLLNQLLKDDKAIVSSIQGTTRDIIEDTVNINGILFRFIDTAGIRHTNDEIEQLGIERSVKAAYKAHIIILMREPGVDFPSIHIQENQIVIEVTNKTSEFQALTGKGLTWLQEQLIKAVPTINEEGVMVTNLRHKQTLDLALIDIRRSITSIENLSSGDLISEDLRQCLLHLGEILGEITSNEILGNIFAHFCIGK